MLKLMRQSCVVLQDDIHRLDVLSFKLGHMLMSLCVIRLGGIISVLSEAKNREDGSWDLLLERVHRWAVWGWGENTSDGCSSAFLLKRSSRWIRREMSWVGGEQHVVKSCTLASASPSCENNFINRNSTRPLRKNTLGSGNERAVCSERRRGTFSTFKTLHYLHPARFLSFFLSFISRASAEILPCGASVQREAVWR